MTFTPPHADPQSTLSRQRRRRLERGLHKLFLRGVCSFCGSDFKPGTSSAGGFDARGNVVLACESCVGRVAEIFSFGLELSGDHPALARLNDAARRGGINIPIKSELGERPWKDADRIWFARNPKRAHHARVPFPGEFDEEAAEIPAEYALIVLVRQVEPGSRIRTVFYPHNDLLPLPDDEAAAHAMFEIAAKREPRPLDRQALYNLIEKYRVRDADGAKGEAV
jgi:hypothetical protein